MADFTHIRDLIQVNGKLKARIDAKNLNPGDTIRLVAQQIQHEANFDLNLFGFNVVIVAGEYDSNGGSINVSPPKPEKDGEPGRVGTEGKAGHGALDNRAGGDGTPGDRGLGGGAATSVRIICEFLRGAHVVANGGTGGKGGEGGAGGKGGAGEKGPPPGKPGDGGFFGTSGGNGGSGGDGGPGGRGGQVLVAHITASAAPVLEAAGGLGGSGGSGGRGGPHGKLSEFGQDDNGRPGPAGANGPSGAAGSATDLQISADDYVTRVRAELGPAAAEWVAYRLTVGEYLYRRYNPEVPANAGDLIRAMQEFDAVLRFDPKNAQAFRLQQQILADQNILGLPRELDLIPDFTLYSTAFQAFGNLVFGAFNQGIETLLTTTVLDEGAKALDLQKDNFEKAVADTKVELQAAMSAAKNAADDDLEAEARVTEVNNQIHAALDEMNHQTITIGGILSIVGEIAGAVASVAAAVPSAGTSLLALAPDVVFLTESVSDNAGPIIDALFTDLRKTKAEFKNVTDAYDKVNKDVTEIAKGAKAFINFVDVVQKLVAGTTPDNAKVVGLLQRAVELKHAQLLADLRRAQADLTVAAVGAKLERANALLVEAQQLSAQLHAEVDKLGEAGLTVVRNTQMQLDSLLGFAFRAQRSVEIYTLKSEVQHLFLDAGYLEPDKERDFAEKFLDPIDLIQAYIVSFDRLLQPIKMQEDYQAFFSDQNHLDADSLRLSFTAPELLQNFRDTHDLQFTIELRDLPAAHFDAKVQAVFVAFVGATSPSKIISCEVRHGDRYEQKRPDGTAAVQLLQPHTNTRQASTSSLQLAGVNFVSDTPLTAPQALSFWGRGVAGLWGLSIPQSEFDLHHPDLTGLSEIQVFVGYQFFR
jgi:hypothetical protein